MSRTNSNSITGLFVEGLNENSAFKDAITKYMKDLEIDIPSGTIFYDGTHQSLLYREMEGKEVDIIARIPGKRKPVLMIEVKAGVRENLQDSQSKGGAYQKTAKKYGIPLIYIIPKYYEHKKDIPNIATTIEWETILSIARKNDSSFITQAQIEKFVEISEEDGPLSEEERILLSSQSLLMDIYDTKRKVLSEIEPLLKIRKVVSDHPQENKYGVGYYYKYRKDDLFIGFNPCREDEYFFSLCIQENASTDNDDKLWYEDGWYYVPVQNCECVEGDEKILTGIRRALSEKKIFISDNFKKYLCSFYTLREKIANLAANYAEGKLGEPYPKKNDGDSDKGFCFGEESASDYFLGLSFAHSIFSLDIHQSLVDKNKSKDLQEKENEDYYAFRLDKYTELFNSFVNSSSGEELQKNFNKLVDAAKKDADSYRKA